MRACHVSTCLPVSRSFARVCPVSPHRACFPAYPWSSHPLLVSARSPPLKGFPYSSNPTRPTRWTNSTRPVPWRAGRACWAGVLGLARRAVPAARHSSNERCGVPLVGGGRRSGRTRLLGWLAGRGSRTWPVCGRSVAGSRHLRRRGLAEHVLPEPPPSAHFALSNVDAWVGGGGVFFGGGVPYRC